MIIGTYVPLLHYEDVIKLDNKLKKPLDTNLSVWNDAYKNFNFRKTYKIPDFLKREYIDADTANELHKVNAYILFTFYSIYNNIICIIS